MVQQVYGAVFEVKEAEFNAIDVSWPLDKLLACLINELEVCPVEFLFLSCHL
jgi:hypothetical protein